MAKHDGVGSKRLEVADGIEKRLAFGHARALWAHVDDVRSQPFPRNLERRARSRGWLEEQVDDGATEENARAADLVASHPKPAVASVEHGNDIVPRELRDSKQVSMGPHGRAASVKVALVL